MHILCILCVYIIYIYLFIYCAHIVCILCIYCAHIVCILCTYCAHIVCILCVYCAYIVRILCIYCAHIVCVLCTYCVYIAHILCILCTYCAYIVHNVETPVGQKKKNWDSSGCRVSRKSFRAVFWARVPQVHSPALEQKLFFISESLLAYRSRIPRHKNHALHCTQ